MAILFKNERIECCSSINAKNVIRSKIEVGIFEAVTEGI